MGLKFGNFSAPLARSNAERAANAKLQKSAPKIEKSATKSTDRGRRQARNN